MAQKPDKARRPEPHGVELIAAHPVESTTQYRGARAVRFWMLAVAVSLAAWAGLFLLIDAALS